MYNTVREMHIALDMGLQQIDSNRKQSISPEHKDMALNYAVLQFIETRTNPKTNIKREGFEDTQKRYDDIRELKVSEQLPTYNLDNKVFSILPIRYYKRVSIGAKVVYSKDQLPIPSSKQDFTYYVVPFPDDNSSGLKYNNFRIFDGNENIVFHIGEYPNVSKFYSSDSKFTIVNLVLDYFDTTNSEVYWEKWNNIHKPNSFIFVTINSSSSFNLAYDNMRYPYSITSNTISYSKYLFANGVSRPVSLYSSENEFDVLGNSYYHRNKHLNPSAYIEGNRLYIYNGSNFVVPAIDLVYLKKPKLINSRTNQSCEITVNREIVDLALQKLMVYIKDEGYQHIVNESQIIE